MTKKILALALALMMALLCFAACGGKTDDVTTTAAPDAEPASTDPAADTADWDKISQSGKLVIGITIFAPMDYYKDENGDKDDNDNITGFDADLARAVCEKLGLEPDFQLVDWDIKETELASGTIDCIWNGLTLNPDLKMTFSDPYMTNSQVLVIKKDNADKYAELADFVGANVVAESGSAGEGIVAETAELKDNPYAGSKDMQSALLEVVAGTSDVAVVDSVMAGASISADSSFKDLMIVEGIALTQEEYAIGLRVDCGVTVDKINEALAQVRAEGILNEIAEAYGVKDSIK